MRSFHLLLVAVGLATLLAHLPTRAATGQSWDDARKHWAFQPITRPKPPRIQQPAAARNAIDAFLLARLEAAGLSFAPPADPRALLRRLTFDLTGLPPTFEEMEAFARDPSPEAYAAAIDRLLASPRYGERWGRHWLDVARYADTKDLVLLYGTDAVRPYAYTYRDYVIRALNEDLPINTFVQDQLAADLAEPPVPGWRLAALGFLTLGRLFDNNVHDQIDDQIDTVTRGFLGLTVACARCHDHKYDAITQADYYGLYGVFASTEQPYDLPLIQDPKSVPGGPEFEAKLAAARQELEKHIDSEFEKLTGILRQRIGDYLVRAATTKPDITETTQFALSLTPDDFRPTLVQRTRRFLERHLQPDDRIFGPWARLRELPEEEFASRSAIVVGELQASRSFNRLVVDTLAAAPLTNQAALARTYGDLLLRVHEEGRKPAAGSPGLSADQKELLPFVDGERSPVWFPRRDTPDHMSRPDKDRYGTLVLALDKLAAHAPQAPAARAMVVRDLPNPYQPHIFRRGNPSRPGDPVPRGFLRVLNDGQPAPFGRGSGRLDLARAITSPANPLTARVFVNRVWMHHFGDPLTPSTTDFGTRSDPPTHADLLDWLASELVASGWSLKHLHRTILLSAAYQQSSDTSQPAALQADPDNRLLWHYPRRRLDWESMRDSLLAISGRLDPTLGGRPVDVATDPLNRRRTVYGLVDRQNLPASFRAFDFAVPDQCSERRPKTSVPQQALYALNSPFVMEQARALMKHPDVDGQPDPRATVDALFRRVLGRRPTDPEVQSAIRFIRTAPDQAGAAGPLPTAWDQLAQVLLASNEAVFLD